MTPSDKRRFNDFAAGFEAAHEEMRKRILNNVLGEAHPHLSEYALFLTYLGKEKAEKKRGKP